MKHTVITTDGHVVALEKITCYDRIGFPVPVECNLCQFKKDLDLWIELFNKIWPNDEPFDKIIGYVK